MSIHTLVAQLAVTLVGGDSGSTVNIPSTPDNQVLHNALNIAYSLGGTVAVIIIIIGGIMYATSGGESAGLTKAKNMILYAVVGLVVILVAFAITNFVIARFK
jgi:hypothetical protein